MNYTKTKDKIILHNEVLFVESFLRTVEFYDPNIAHELPEYTLFYMGASTAEKNMEGYNGRKNYFGYTENKACFLRQSEALLKIDDRTEAVILSSTESYDKRDNCWYRSKDYVRYIKRDITHPQVRSFASFQIEPRMNLVEIDAHGNFITNFPRGIYSTIEVNTTYAYLLHRESYSICDYIAPTSYVTLFIRNQGFQREIRIVNEAEFAKADVANLCLGDVKVRDFRKKKERFEY